MRAGEEPPTTQRSNINIGNATTQRATTPRQVHRGPAVGEAWLYIYMYIYIYIYIGAKYLRDRFYALFRIVCGHLSSAGVEHRRTIPLR